MEMLINEGQFEAASHVYGPELVIAGAGTGKTHMLTMRIGYLLQAGIQANQILLLTFTNAAADEMKERAKAMFGPAVDGLTACTYHSFANNMLRLFLPEGRRDFSILTPSDERMLISSVISDFGYKGMPRTNKIQSLFSAHVNRDTEIVSLLETHEFEKMATCRDELITVFTKLQERKARLNVMNYDDILSSFEELLDDRNIRNTIEQTYPFVMVDEFQDTNNIQARIIHTMTSTFNNICVVGDDFQSIYAFRGSNVENFIDFPDFHPNTKIVQMNENYRCSQQILDFANAVMSHMMDTEYAFNSKHEINLQAGEINGVKKSGEKPELIACNTSKDSAEYILEHAKELQEADKLSDLSVIYRNTMSAHTLEAQLIKDKIPYVKKGGVKFFERDDVQDLLAYIRVIRNPFDEIAWFRILQVHPSIGKQRSSQVSRICTAAVPQRYGFLLSTPFATGTSATDRKVNAELSTLYMKLCSVVDATDICYLIDYFGSFYKETRQRRLLETEERNRASDDTINKEKDAIAKIDETMEVLRDLAAEFKTTANFMDNLSLDNAAKLRDDDENTMTLTTVHSAKGLEWEEVMILDVTDQTFPNMSSANESGMTKAESTAVIQEELRCFYVAITRARKRLVLFEPEKVLSFGKLVMAGRSPYMDDSTVMDCVSFKDIYGFDKK